MAPEWAAIIGVYVAFVLAFAVIGHDHLRYGWELLFLAALSIFWPITTLVALFMDDPPDRSLPVVGRNPTRNEET